MPLFLHDCPRCRHIGSTNALDIYVCNPTIVARHGDDGPAYRSWPDKAFITDASVLRIWETHHDDETATGDGLSDT